MTPIALRLLIAITGLSVISDSMLLPFYPQYFDQVFDLQDPVYAGRYLASYCLVVMLAFPLWAQLNKRLATLPLLLVTQSLAALMSLACFAADTLMAFWLAALLMMLCKASYLLIYPFMLRQQPCDQHSHIIGLLTVIVEFCAIAGALLGGLWMQHFEPRQAFIVMAGGDMLQALVCAGLLYRGQGNERPTAAPVPAAPGMPRTLLKLALVKLMFFFSAFLGFHFFTQYWAMLTPHPHRLLSAGVFAIPAIMALLGLAYNRYARQPPCPSRLSHSLMLAALGAGLQALPEPLWVVIGRLLFGWALFQSIVRIDWLVFKLSEPQRYAQDYSRLRMAQSLGVVLAVYSASHLLRHWPPGYLFAASALGLCLSGLCFTLLLRPSLSAQSSLLSSSIVHPATGARYD